MAPVPARNAMHPYLSLYRIREPTFAVYDTIYLLTAVGFPAGGSSTVHVYTETAHTTTKSTQTIHRTTQFTN